MYKDNRIAVVVPAYNVENQIGEVLRTVKSFVDHIIVVDDASTDQTYFRAKDSEDKRVIVLRHSDNQGVGGAMVTGFRMAMKLDANVVIKIDGDGQMDVLHLKRLIEPLISDGYSYAKGNRFLHSYDLEKMPKVRLLGNFSMTFLTKLASGYWHIFDPQNGFIAIRVDALEDLDFNRIAKRYFFENDMLVNLNVHNHRVKDVAMPAIYGNESSSMRIHRVLFSFPFYLFRRFWYRIYQKYVLRDFSPIALFLFLGLPLVLWGAGFGAYIWWRGLTAGEPATAGTVMLGVLPFLVGFELLLQAMILDIHETPR
jgi:glycosyltransferase involved in cell wall biosynthesis